MLAAGGRFDIGLTIPDGTVTLALDAGQADDSVTLAFSPDGAPPAAVADGPIFDPLRYGTPGSPTHGLMTDPSTCGLRRRQRATKSYSWKASTSVCHRVSTNPTCAGCALYPS
jgi:hypothetical protein